MTQRTIPHAQMSEARAVSWPTLFAPPAFLLLPVALAAYLTLPPAAGGAAALVNGLPGLVEGRPPTSYVVWSVAVTALTAAGGALALVASLYLAAGRFGGSVAAAIREAARRSGTLLALAALVALRLLPHALVVASSAVVTQWTGQRWIVTVTVAVAVVIALPVMLVLPVVLVAGHPVTGAFRRARETVSGRRTKATLLLAAATSATPALAFGVHLWLAPLLPDAVKAVAAALGAALLLAVIPLTAQALASFHVPAEPRPEPARTAPAMPAAISLLLIGVGAVTVLSPLPEVTDGTVRMVPVDDPDRAPSSLADPEPSDDDHLPGEVRPFMDRGDLAHLAIRPDGTPLLAGYDPRAVGATTLTCVDMACDVPSLGWVRPYAFTDDPVSATTLADGSVVHAGWQDGPEATLHLIRCVSTGQCTPSAGPVTRAGTTGRLQDLALAAGPAGGVLVAVANRDGDAVTELSLTSCDDARCPRPRTVPLAAALPYDRASSTMRGRLAVAVVPPDRPVVTWLEPASSTLRVIVCDTAACLRPELTTHRLADEFSSDDTVKAGAVAVAVPPDGRPVIAYQGGAGDLRLLRCRGQDCARTDAMRLGSGLTSPGVSSLVLDGSLRSYEPTVPAGPTCSWTRPGGSSWPPTTGGGALWCWRPATAAPATALRSPAWRVRVGRSRWPSTGPGVPRWPGRNASTTGSGGCASPHRTGHSRGGVTFGA